MIKRFLTHKIVLAPYWAARFGLKFNTKAAALSDIGLYIGLYVFCFWANPKNQWVLAGATAFLFLYPLLSNVLQQKTWAEMGLDPAHLVPGLRASLAWGLPLGGALILLGWNRPLLRPGLEYDLVAGSWIIPISGSVFFVLLYPLFAFAQELAFMGFLFDRLRQVFEGNEKRAALWGVLAFSASHAPHPILMPLTLAAGTVFFSIFLRYRNFLPIAVIHACLGLLAFKNLNWFLESLAVGRYYVVQ